MAYLNAQDGNVASQDIIMFFHKLPFICQNIPYIKPIICLNIPLVVVYRKNAGFTLIELIITLTIAAILLAIAAPNMRNFLQSDQVTSQINDLMADLSFARTEAVKRNGSVSVCASNNQINCNTSNWTSGRIIWADTNGNKTVDSGEEILRVGAVLEGTTLTASVFADTSKFRFLASGAVDSPTGGNFRLCDTQNRNGRQLAVDATGKSAITQTNCP